MIILSITIQIIIFHIVISIYYSNDSSSSYDLLTAKYQTSFKKKSFDSYPYSNGNEFFNFDYSKFTKKGNYNCEDYKKYLNKAKEYDESKNENFNKNKYDKNIKSNLKELEN
jgi:hypothetical protein